ncbi:MAG: hypothetical protein NVS2B2_31360 [Ktedonobacteraceae bacterium]
MCVSGKRRVRVEALREYVLTPYDPTSILAGNVLTPNVPAVC